MQGLAQLDALASDNELRRAERWLEEQLGQDEEDGAQEDWDEDEEEDQ